MIALGILAGIPIRGLIWLPSFGIAGLLLPRKFRKLSTHRFHFLVTQFEFPDCSDFRISRTSTRNDVAEAKVRMTDETEFEEFVPTEFRIEIRRKVKEAAIRRLATNEVRNEF